MIAIVNVSDSDSAFGVHEYELRINSKVIARFEHVREEGLEICLQKASEAARNAKWQEIAAVLKELENKAELTAHIPVKKSKSCTRH